MKINKTYVEVDWSVGNVTAPLAFNWRGGNASIQVIVTGTINFDLQSTNSDIQSGATPQWLVDSADATGITASKWLSAVNGPRFFRLNVNSFTPGATVTLNIVQSDV